MAGHDLGGGHSERPVNDNADDGDGRSSERCGPVVLREPGSRHLLDGLAFAASEVRSLRTPYSRRVFCLYFLRSEPTDASHGPAAEEHGVMGVLILPLARAIPPAVGWLGPPRPRGDASPRPPPAARACGQATKRDTRSEISRAVCEALSSKSSASWTSPSGCRGERAQTAP
jgi:hypothetical protein